MARSGFLSFLLLFSAVSFAADGPKTVWDGIYSPEQAKRGEPVYAEACGRCHRQDLSGYTGLRGDKFIENWRADSLESLWVRISKTMPAGAPGSLQESEYLNILAFILRANAFPAGQEALTRAAIPGIRFEGKTGPEPVPDFALVQTVGCLQKNSEGVWKVSRASEPIRTRNPQASSGTESKSAAEAQLGDHSFRLLDGSMVPETVTDASKVMVKGFLIRKQNDDRINPTSVQVLGPHCP